VVEIVEQPSTAARAGVSPGDVVVRVGASTDFAGAQDFSRAAGALNPRATDRGARGAVGRRPPDLHAGPRAGVFGDLASLLSSIRGSPFLRSRAGFPDALVSVEGSDLPALREASRLSQAYEVLMSWTCGTNLYLERMSNGAPPLVRCGPFRTCQLVIIEAWAVRRLTEGADVTQ
jgi:hypothetical protein